MDNITEIQTITREYYEQLNADKLDNLGEMDARLETNNLPILNKEVTDNLGKPITATEIESAI